MRLTDDEPSRFDESDCLSLCHADDHIRAFDRGEWIAHRDFTPIRAPDDDCLAELVADGSTGVVERPEGGDERLEDGVERAPAATAG